jgi:hypothetical protein
MSLTIAIRDYLENLNIVADSFTDPSSIIEVIKTTIFYVLNSTAYLFVYLFTFQWIRDITHLPVILPTISEKILQETYVLNDRSNLLNILPVSNLESNKFLLGLVNSFFLALPLSVPKIVSIRQWLIKGSVAGVASILGFRMGQTLFYAGILFGLRAIMIPWLANEPWTYIIGMILLVRLVYEMTQESLVPIPFSQTQRHLNIFLVNLALAWTEQSILYQYSSNNSLGTSFSNLDVFVTANSSEFWFSHVSYVVALFIGGLCFDLIFLYAITALIESSQVWFRIPLSTWKKQSNIWLLRISLALSFSSIPYYTLDYLFLAPTGIVSQDTVVTKIAENAFEKNPLTYSRLGVEQEMFLDPFNRRILWANPLQDYSGFSSFETKNYEGERAWKLADVAKRSNITSVAENTKTLAKRLFNNPSIIQERYAVDRKSEVVKEKPSNSSNLGRGLQEKFEVVYFPKARELSADDYTSGKKRIRVRNPLFESRVFDYYLYTPGDPLKENFFSVINDSFPTLLNVNSDFQSRQEGIIKKKYYSNPIYKNLLNVYVDSLLDQQPKEYRLKPEEEKELYKARLILQDYFNSLRAYSELPYQKQFDVMFNGSKSFATKVYSQQYKGTLKVVRRLFGVTWDEQENPAQTNKLSFDQTLTKENPTNFYHEELRKPRLKQKKRIKLINPTPLYAGWDDDLRQFTLSNRYLENTSVGRQASYPENVDSSSPNQNGIQKLLLKNKFAGQLSDINNSFVKKDFTAWPKNFTNNSKEGFAANNFMFEFKQDFKKKDTYSSLVQDQTKDFEELISEKLPSTMEFLTMPAKPILPPSRGGLVWPGENLLKFKP